MQRLILAITMATVALTFMTIVASAQPEVEFKLGFKALADQIPEIVGQPLENERSVENGDALQQTSTGLMVWRKADNWTAFTDGFQSWVNGPEGVQVRLNDQRFSWEAPAPVPASPTSQPATARPVSASTPTPSPTASPSPSIGVYKLNVIQGELLEANTVWVLGEIRNDSEIPAASVKLSASLLGEAGERLGSATQSYNYLAPGDSIGFRLQLPKPMAPYVRADASATASGTSFARYEKLAVEGTPMVKADSTSAGGDAFEWTSSITNQGDTDLTACVAYVWFLDEYDRVLWADTAFPSASLAPNASALFTVRTLRHKYNPQIAAINQVRAYAVGIRQ